MKASVKSHLRVKRWESENDKSWGFLAEGLRGGSLLGVSGKWSAWLVSLCSWITTRRWRRCAERYGTLDAELEVQRTIKRAERTAFLRPHPGKLSVPRWFTLITKGSSMSCVKEKWNVLVREQKTLICGSQFGKNRVTKKYFRC